MWRPLSYHADTFMVFEAALNKQLISVLIHLVNGCNLIFSLLLLQHHSDSLTLINSSCGVPPLMPARLDSNRTLYQPQIILLA